MHFILFIFTFILVNINIAYCDVSYYVQDYVPFILESDRANFTENNNKYLKINGYVGYKLNSGNWIIADKTTIYNSKYSLNGLNFDQIKILFGIIKLENIVIDKKYVFECNMDKQNYIYKQYLNFICLNDVFYVDAKNLLLKEINDNDLGGYMMRSYSSVLNDKNNLLDEYIKTDGFKQIQQSPKFINVKIAAGGDMVDTIVIYGMMCVILCLSILVAQSKISEYCENKKIERKKREKEINDEVMKEKYRTNPDPDKTWKSYIDIDTELEIKN